MAARVKAEVVTVWKLFSNLRKELWTRERWRHLKKSSFGNSLDKRFMTSTRVSEERDRKVSYRIYSINRPGRLLNFWTLRVGAYSRWVLIRGFCNKTINANNKTRSNKARFL